ncbi:hypothetical protein K7G42_07020 [Streptococcus parauberis]|uniref:Uncharacterized protein n=1 Tax=Streptococcus parauberis KRS-02083 TaxID=1207545 RepID=A0ABN0IS60_9STRE|nr:hypothetical protein [Streptococcus parauberis]EMG25746.1 hypothetical protein SPJ1_1157 [Streptococcus parauberis KRS-02083]QBX27469.1 hypothetical protein Javan392_0013 [Streptococcus phage Javan392]WEM64336.1 hypothetical protein P1T45_06735 [Streptococcus parauberis]WOF46164.1 hypothetical protein K7G42_07020 [Streptococcus parauberis]
MMKTFSRFVKAVIAKANLLDIMIQAGFIKKSHLDYAMNQLDFDDQIILKEEMESSMTIYYREYQCGDCDREFSETSEYPLLSCPRCQSDDIIITFKNKAYE